MLFSSFCIIVIHEREIGAKGEVEKDRYALGERAGVGYDLVDWTVENHCFGRQRDCEEGVKGGKQYLRS